MPEPLLYLLTRVQHRLSAHVKRELKQEGLRLSKGQMSVLVNLEELGETTMGSLGQALDTDGAALTRLVDKLERRALVARRTNHEDRRQVLIRLTAEGERQAAIVKRIVTAANLHIQQGLSARDLAAFARVNAAILEKFQ